VLVTEKSTESYAQREAGGKGLNLYLLSREGFSVPAWVVLPARAFRQFVQYNGLESFIAERIGDEPRDYRSAAAEIRLRIDQAPFPEEIESLIEQAWKRVGKGLIAVRSSGLDEDSSRHSFAGQLSSFLFVSSLEEAKRCVKECWASGFSERGLVYRAENGILQNRIDVAVVFQEMVESEKSGVMFTCDPIAQDPTRIVVNSVYGVGEGLVSGLLDADTFAVEKSTGRQLAATLARKESSLRRDPGRPSGLVEVPVEAALHETPSLSERELVELADLGRRIERFYRFPQDVEWGWRAGTFYLLQSRPVTTEVRQHEGTLNVWDNSNIVESYGGITLPLTVTFAHYVYNRVYVQMCQILLVPQKEIDRMGPFLKNMVGVFYGRVFYNILNWYKLTSILPGYRHNRSFMETMMGTQHQLQDEIAERVKLDYGVTWVAKIRRFVSGLKFFWFHLTAQTMVDDFLAYFKNNYEYFRKIDYARLSASEIYSEFKRCEETMLFEWKAPIINDYLCMVHFGILKKLSEKWLGHLGSLICNDLMAGNGNLESAEPTRELIRLAGLVNANPELRRLVETTEPVDCLEALEQSSFGEFRDRVRLYIERYGHRCMSEMKLEQRDLQMDPSFLFVCLRNYLRSGQVSLHEYEERERQVRDGAEKQVRANLSGLRLLVFLWSLKHARRAVRNRENTRFCRTRVYGIVRRMFYGVGKELAIRGLVERPEDVFYLTLEEMRGMFDGVLPCQNVTRLVALRKEEYATYVDKEPASRFVTRGIVYWMNDHFPEPPAVETDLPPNALKGTGCCPGVVEGVVRVIVDPSDNMELGGEILVTMRTDPGWIPLYPTISGLLVERGGLLSHSAIVAREMGLPTVVGVQGLTQKLRSGMRIRFNGQTGIVEILDGNEV
jgi:pyruvate,water dikinase